MNLREMMAELDSTDALETEPTFLDRALSKDEAAALREQLAEPEGEPREVGEDLEAGGSEEGPVSQPEPETEVDEPEREPEIEEPEIEPETEEATGGHDRGGSGAVAGTAVAAGEAGVGPGPQTRAENEPPAEDAQRVVVQRTDAEAAQKRISAERKSDQRDAIQAAGRSGGSGSGTESAELPRSGFRLPDEASQPQIRNLPAVLVAGLRRQIARAAMREKGVSEAVAQAFAERLSLGALVTAFIMAGLDTRLETDEATGLACELFRSQDPLLGAALTRIEAVQDEQAAAAQRTEALVELAREQARTSGVLEQLLAYSVADRTENFLYGSHDIHAAPIAHKDVVYLRDRAREETAKLRAREKQREGRPMR